MNIESVPQSNESLVANQCRRADGLWEGIARVSGMDCGACSVEIEQIAQQIPEFKQFLVNPASNLARWVTSNPESISQLAHKIARLGYALGLQEEQFSELQTQQQKKLSRTRFLKFLVAAFCMMQIMMYSTPEYLFSLQEIGLSETHLLRWAQWVLTLPLMLYCASSYFKRAWVALIQGRLVMEQPIVLGLLLAFILSSFNLTNPSQHVWFDSIAMLLTLLLGVQMLIENRTSQALKHLSELQPDLPMQVEVPDGKGGWEMLAIAHLRSGNIYRLPVNKTIPVDSELAHQDSSVWVDEAMRTGETDPVYKKPGEVIQAGSRILSPMALLKCIPVEEGDSLIKLGQLLLHALATKPSHQDKIDRVLPWFVFSILVCALGTSIYWAGFRAMPNLAASSTLAVLIVSCPCALALALPLVRLFGIRYLAEKGVLVRNPKALDILAKVHTLAMDKTGTLTKPRAKTVLQRTVKNHPEIKNPSLLNALCALAQYSNHPLSKAIVSHFLQNLNFNIQPVQWETWKEYAGAGLLGTLKLDGQAIELRLGSAVHCKISCVEPHASNTTVFASCCVANQLNHLEVLQFTFEFNTDPKLPDQLNELKKHCISLNLLSGDQTNIVNHWASEMPFNTRQGGMSPADKTNWIATQQKNHLFVAMVGDGLNDSAAFAQADVSFAASGSSTLSAGQADFLLLHSGIAGVLASFQIAQRVEKIGRENLIWALVYNGITLPIAAMGLLTPWMASLGMGLSSLLVFVNALRLQNKGR
jgi:Cu2+-exporting ATPase